MMFRKEAQSFGNTEGVQYAAPDGSRISIIRDEPGLYTVDMTYPKFTIPTVATRVVVRYANCDPDEAPVLRQLLMGHDRKLWPLDYDLCATPPYRDRASQSEAEFLLAGQSRNQSMFVLSVPLTDGSQVHIPYTLNAEVLMAVLDDACLDGEKCRRRLDESLFALSKKS
jgi:hypothetical protein